MRRGGRLLNAAATRWAYEAASDPARAVRPVRFGQPVAIGRREGGEITALRLAFSAGQLARATASSSAAAALEASIHQALDTAAAVVGG
jgi:hypothetical protein